MGASLTEIKKRIGSTKKTSQITSAMQVVSGAKLNKSEQAATQFQVYASKVREIVTHLVSSQLPAYDSSAKGSQSADVDYHSMLVSRPVKRTGYIVITSDRGLVGSYNSSILKQTLSMLEKDHQSADEYAIMAIGSTGADFFKSRKYDLSYELRGLSDQPSFEEVRKIVTTATKMYEQEVFDELYVCYNHHVNSLTSEFRAEKMLPISDIDTNEAKSYDVEYLLEPNEDAILENLLPQYAESLIYGAILDAKTAEHAASMTSMKSATDNAGKIIDELTISYNRARQASITQEITEIVGGAAALE
ncbi:F0F1 ATP synthase subunit gamma [Vagococcus entomophilus]|uniref:ATP synthase gamma chain n=1 Tax=Vagococcus entomophilus TaxID=1160095 RepID=A0A430AJ48_9ENTE|nr:F0F1 ATP synthase subunit gamma [Vagococcus entomophilus]RSU07947.1 F0F1 ATP synthase subunit gamma [Vagococcus entomophilus]